jgi:hypothetical protein
MSEVVAVTNAELGKMGCVSNLMLSVFEPSVKMVKIVNGMSEVEL